MAHTSTQATSFVPFEPFEPLNQGEVSSWNNMETVPVAVPRVDPDGRGPRRGTVVESRGLLSALRNQLSIGTRSAAGTDLQTQAMDFSREAQAATAGEERNRARAAKRLETRRLMEETKAKHYREAIEAGPRLNWPRRLRKKVEEAEEARAAEDRRRRAEDEEGESGRRESETEEMDDTLGGGGVVDGEEANGDDNHGEAQDQNQGD